MRPWAVAALAGALGALLIRPPRMIAYEALAADLDAAVGGERRIFDWRLGCVSYRVAGSGSPVVLVHGIDAAASAFELRRNVATLGADFRVYAPDLLGFGLSDRPALRYNGDTYVELLRDFLRGVVGAPAHLVASSLSAAYAVAVAHEHPDLVRSLVLICPAGIELLGGAPGMGQRGADLLLGLPLLGSKLFAGLVSRPSVRYFLRSMVYHDPRAVTPALVETYHRLSQRPGGRWAPQAFLGGRLNRQIGDAFAGLRQPVLLVWGKDARTIPLESAPAFLERNPRATLKVFENAGLVPHDERAELFNPFVRDWLKEQEV